jgi:hypothetical protein
MAVKADPPYFSRHSDFRFNASPRSFWDKIVETQELFGDLSQPQLQETLLRDRPRSQNIIESLCTFL